MGFIAHLMEKARRMTVWDYGVLKAVLVTFGIIIGAYLSDFVRQYIWYVAVVFAVLYGVMIYRLFGSKRDG
jgi:putative Mn2+ efflux pump MntP